MTSIDKFGIISVLQIDINIKKNERRKNMAIINCEECGKEISDRATSCPYCGAPTGNIQQSNTKFCKHCGEIIDKECVVCPKCGKQVEELSNSDKNIIINNSSSASSTNTYPARKKKKYSILLDIILICCTGGLWIIWMIIRPKYEY